ncbi:MAG: hypothetical protein LBQ66_16360 [Planctomycetaceae bacterium]|jgi:hypothetical protein|nr:hypothetical protein [Planctomycetaceae bacterium]
MFAKQIFVCAVLVLGVGMFSSQLLADIEINADITPDEVAAAVSNEDEQYKTDVTITGTVTKEPDYDKNEFVVEKTEWKFSLTADNDAVLTVTSGKLDEWQDDNFVECNIYNTKTGSAYVSDSAEVKYTFSKKIITHQNRRNL